MGPQYPGSFFITTSSTSASLLSTTVASWLLLVSCRIEFCLAHSPPAAARPTTHPQALPWSVLHFESSTAAPPSATSEGQVSHPRVPIVKSSSTYFLVPQSSASVSQASSPSLSVSQSPSPQFLVSQSHPAVPRASSPSLPVSRSHSTQFMGSHSNGLKSQSPSTQSLTSQSSSSESLIPHPPSPQPGSSPGLLLPTTHSPPPSRSPQTPKHLSSPPAASLFFTHSRKSGLVSGEASRNTEDKEENAATDHGGTEEGSGGKQGGGGVTMRQDTGGWPVGHRGSRTSHTKPRLSPDAGRRVGGVLSHSVRRLTSEEEEEEEKEESGPGAPWDEKSSHEVDLHAGDGDKLVSGVITVLRQHHDLNGGRYPMPLLARGALDLTSGEQDQPERLLPPAGAPGTGSTPHGGAGQTAGLLNVNEMMVNSLRSLEQEYTSDEVHRSEGNTVSKEVEGGEEEDVEEEEEEEEREVEKELVGDSGGHPPLDLEDVSAPHMHHHQHLHHPHLQEAEKERQVMLEALARRPQQAGPSDNFPSAVPPLLPHHPAPPPQPRPTFVTQETHHIQTPLAEMVTEEPHSRPGSPHPPQPSPLHPPRLGPAPSLETSPANTRGLSERRRNSLDQKSRKENFHDSSLAFPPAPGYKRTALRPAEDSLASEGVAVRGGGSSGSVLSAATKSAGSVVGVGVGPGGGGGLRGPALPGSLYLHGIRAAEPGQRGGTSPAADIPLPAVSSYRWSPRTTNDSVTPSLLHPLLPPADGKTPLAQGKETHAPAFPQATASPGNTAPLPGLAGRGASGSLGLDRRETSRGGRREEKNITFGERREKNMVEATLVRENGGGNLRPVTQVREGRGAGGEGGGGGKEGRERERGGGVKKREMTAVEASVVGERRDEEERGPHGGNFAASLSMAGTPQGRRKRLLKRDSETTAQAGAGGGVDGLQESRGQRPPMAPRDTFQEASQAAGVPQAPDAGAPHHAKVSAVGETQAGDAGGVHTAGTFGTPHWVAPVPGAGDPPPRHHVAPNPAGSGGADYSFLPPGFATVDTSEGCQCWQTHDDSFTPEEECRCRGRHITQLPANLSTSMDRLSLTKMGLYTLGHRNLSVYSVTIKELILRDVDALRSLESDVFRNMPQLRTIYISHAPRLVQLPPDIFHVSLPSLKVLRIVHTGLTVLPGLSQLRLNHGILQLLDLENNKIKRITTASVSIRAIQLLLDNNDLRTVEASAFNGSEIDKLSLKGNVDLTELHLMAFEGVKSLTSLDLSNTRITRLPTEGLEGLESLHLTGTYDLKVFPSVYSFKQIRTAHLTYPYHCCAFRYPRLHDPTEHRKHEEFLKKMEKMYCGDITSPSPEPSHVGVGWRRRRRRDTSTHTPAFSPVTRLDTTPEAEGTREQGRGKVVVSASSSQQLKRRHLPTLEEQIAKVETITSSSSLPPHVTSSTPSLPPVVSPKGSPGLSGLNPALSEHIKEDKKAQKDQTKITIMDLRGEKKDKEEEAKVKEENGLVRKMGEGMHIRETNMTSPYEYESGTQASVENFNNFTGHLPQHTATHLPPHLDPHVPSRLTRSSSSQHNTSSPHPQSPHPETHNWGASLTNSASSPRVADPDDPEDSYSFPGAPDEDIARPGTSVDLEEDPEEPLDHSFHSFHSEANDKDLVSSETSKDLDSYPKEYQDHAFHPYPIPGTHEHLGPGSLMDLHDPEEPLEHEFRPYHPGDFADGGPEFEEGDHHVFAPAGGFGDVVVGQEEPAQASDVDQFFHVNEVTVSPEKTVCGGNLSKNYRDVMCYPEPDAFNPCEDIMGNLGLRVAVWVVVVTAVFGNLAVMIVLMSTRFKMTVSMFLICNLAVADLCMGLYLLIIAAMDLHTIGVYFNSAIYWQNGPGCKVAGFLTVFASELSILTLTVITLERWYAITYAIHLNKRLRLPVAVRIMVFAWIYALTMAALPLFGVSGYSKTSICLPMETADPADQAYLLILLITNGLAFVLICVCYAKMYYSIAGNNLAANTSDTTVAKRMALLVFTDFACWAPIAFFGLTAVCGYPLISVTHAKFLLVFFYPLNSCANPYLYAILTKQYRRDLFLMLARHGFFTRRAMKYKGGCSTNTWLNHHHVCVSGGGGGGGGSGGPSRRISTMTQITTCGEWRGRARDGSEESLPRQASPPLVKSISAMLVVPVPGPPQSCADQRPSDACRRLQPVAEVHDGRVSPQPASPQTAAAAATSGSPHPIKNCYARMSFTPEQEALLQRYASDHQPASLPSAARRRPTVTNHGDEPVPLTEYTPTTPDTITTPVSPSLDHAV